MNLAKVGQVANSNLPKALESKELQQLNAFSKRTCLIIRVYRVEIGSGWVAGLWSSIGLSSLRVLAGKREKTVKAALISLDQKIRDEARLYLSDEYDFEE